MYFGRLARRPKALAKSADCSSSGAVGQLLIQPPELPAHEARAGLVRRVFLRGGEAERGDAGHDVLVEGPLIVVPTPLAALLRPPVGGEGGAIDHFPCVGVQLYGYPPRSLQPFP